MPNKDKNIPKRRFKEFENADAWEERKLGDLGSVAMNKRIFKEQTSDVGDIPFYKIGTFGGTPDAFISRDIFEEYKSKYQYPEVGDILISASGSIGRTVVYQGYDEYFQDSNIVWLKHDQQLDNSFLKQFYSIVKWQGLEGSTIKRLYNKNILETKITLPSPEEQQKIGTFFKQLDCAIALHQRKLDKLKSLKQAYLSEMFPAEGERVPKRRFPGFTDAWELRKLGEISTHRSGTAIENHFSEDGKYKVISIGSYGLDNKYIDQKNRAVENEVTRSKVVNKNELTMVLNDKTANGNIIGRCLLIEADDEFVINQRTEIISFNSVIYPKFAYVVLNGAFREQVKKIVQGGTQIYVNYSSVEQLYLSLPTLAEQEAIGTFFSTLDQHITLHQRKLEKLKNLKKALLNELFV